MYDILIVGAGITAATLVASLKERFKLCVVDIRNHIGGNCFDYADNGSFIHAYGPHIFHSPSAKIVSFLSRYTEWQPYHYSVTAEVEYQKKIFRVPFPYCHASAMALGNPLADEDVLQCFFRDYSFKMWGINWDLLPGRIKHRVPKDTMKLPQYYPGQFVGMPRRGFTHMIGNMLDGADIRLGTSPTEWMNIPAHRVIFTGRPDCIALPGETRTIREAFDLALDFRTLQIRLEPERWLLSSAALHCCHLHQPWTRKVHYATLTGGNSLLVSTEFPQTATSGDLTPYYPIPLDCNLERYRQISALLRRMYPQLYLAGRLGSYQYLDMFQAVGQGLALARKIGTGII